MCVSLICLSVTDLIVRWQEMYKCICILQPLSSVFPANCEGFIYGHHKRVPGKLPDELRWFIVTFCSRLMIIFIAGVTRAVKCNLMNH